MTFVHHGARIERLVIGLQYANQYGQAQRFLRAAGVPPGTVLLITAPPVPLPSGPVLPGRERAALQGPALARQGDVLTLTLTARNLGPDVLAFGYGACDLQVEIRRVPTGEVVLPLPGRPTCRSIGSDASVRGGAAAGRP